MTTDDAIRTSTTPSTAAGSPVRSGVFWAWTALGLLVVFGLAALTRYLEQNVGVFFADTDFADIASAIEYPVYAIALGSVHRSPAPLTFTGYVAKPNGHGHRLIDIGLFHTPIDIDETESR